MNLSKSKILIVCVFLIGILALALIAFFVIRGDSTNIEYVDHHVPFNDGWTLSVNGNTTSNVELPVKVETHKPETVIFTNTLPGEIPDNMAIISRNYHQMIKVRIGGEEVFSYPSKDWNGFGNIISDEWCLVHIKPEYASKDIEVELINTSAPVFKFSAYVGEFYYGTDNSLVHLVRERAFWGVILGIIVSGIGALLLIVSFIYKNHTKQSTNTAMGIAFLCFGIWMINRIKMCLFPNHSIYVYWISLMCLMFVAPFIFLYSYYRNNTFKKLALFSFRFCLISDLFLVLSCFFIDYNVEYITPFSYFLSITAMLLTSYSLFQGGWGKASKTQSKTDILLDRTEFFSTLIYPTLGVFELVFSSDKLWTEWSMFFMFGMTAYAIIYFCFILWRTFLVVQDRTNVSKKLHDTQLELMMGQIQPHFIFNTLSSIRTLVKIDPDQSYNMLYDFSNYLRANIDNAMNLEGIPFASEVSHIKSYVNIEKVRYADRLNMEYDIQADEFTVPPLSVQPLVENAIKHGVSKKVGGGTVLLKSYERPDCYVVEVNDDGLGFNEESACRVFGECAAAASGKTANDQMDSEFMAKVMSSIDLRDKDGNTITIKEPEITAPVDPTKEHHKSSGMMNILHRLHEMADAKIEITSKEDEGTNVKVYFKK